MSENPFQAYRQIPLNKDQRYLVIGDVHGRFNTLNKLLDKAQYSRSKDVLLSVGDLIDRGPRSAEAVEFFAAAARYAVRGNHEQMVINPSDWQDVWKIPQTGGPATSRSLSASNRDLVWLKHQIDTYPVCLDVGTDDDDNAFRIVHAEQPFSWSETEFQNFLNTSTYKEAGEGSLLWGRADIESIQNGVLPPLHLERSRRRSFCGHTPIKQILEAHNTYWIDTFLAGTLSCIDALTLEQWSVPVENDEFPS